MKKREFVGGTISQIVLLLLLLLLVGFAAGSGIHNSIAIAGEDATNDAVYIPIISGTSESIMHTLALNVSGNGQVKADPDKSNYNHGESVTLTAFPDAGLKFNGWSGDLSGDKNPATLVMDDDKSVTADFTVTVAGEYYISPDGSDNNSGTSETQAWATFDRALKGGLPGDQLRPGDTLIVMDGTYYQSIQPNGGVNGSIGNPITIRAQNDGKAVIDGQGVRTPVEIYVSYMVIEGIVARNSVEHVFRIAGDHNVLRRVSAYNAHIDKNAMAIWISSSHNLVEDCVAAGSGRKMIVVFGPEGEYNTIRRCFTDWREWEGRNWCSSHFPWGEGLEFYGASYNLMENSIAYGNMPRAGLSIMSQYVGKAVGNRIFGSISVLAGMDNETKPTFWGPDPNNPPLTQVQPLVRPGPTQCSFIAQFNEWPELRSGIQLSNAGPIDNTVLQDVFTWGSAGPGIGVTKGAYSFSNNTINRATIFNNGLDYHSKFGGIGTDAHQEDLDAFASITNSYIETIYTGSGYTSLSGEGARLTNRYVNGVLTDEPLWPWPMEGRIQSELGYSVTDIITGIIFGNQ